MMTLMKLFVRMPLSSTHLWINFNHTLSFRKQLPSAKDNMNSEQQQYSHLTFARRHRQKYSIKLKLRKSINNFIQHQKVMFFCQ